MAALAPVSVAFPPTGLPATADGSSGQASISADGRYVVFLSDATNLVFNQDDTEHNGTRYRDVFLHDRLAQVTTLVSGSYGSSTKTGNNQSVSAVISADGRYVAFTSFASDVVAGQHEPEGSPNAGHLDLFLFDRLATDPAERIRLVSHAHGASTTPANHSILDRTPSISADGRRIAFASHASDMVNGVLDEGSSLDIFLYDRGDAQTPASLVLVTRSATEPNVAAGFDAQEATLSADGNYLAFQSYSTNLVPEQVDENSHADIFLFDIRRNQTRLVSGAAGSATVTANAPSFQAAQLALSAHGRFLAFKSFATDLITGQIDNNHNGDLFLFDRDATDSGRIKLISHAASSHITTASGGSAASEVPVINVDLANLEHDDTGLFIAFQSTARDLDSRITDAGDARDLFLYELSTGNNTLVTFTPGRQVPANTFINVSVDNRPGRTPVLSSDGRHLAYGSPATTLVAGQVDSGTAVTNDIFVYDRVTHTNTLLSGKGGSATETGNASSEMNAMSANGATVVYSSEAEDLISRDGNGKADVFLSLPPISVAFDRKPIDLLSSHELNVQDGIRDGIFRVSLAAGIGAREIIDIDLVRGDGARWSTSPESHERALGVATNILSAIVGLKSTISVGDGQEFILLAADAKTSLFTSGQHFSLTARFSDGSSATATSEPIPSAKLEYLGKLADRVGRGEAALAPDRRNDGVFQVTFPSGSGLVTRLDLDRGDGNRWNTIADDPFWVLGAAPARDGGLFNATNGTLPSDGLPYYDGGTLTLFAPEDRPEAASFFTAGKTFRLTIGYDDGNEEQVSVTLTEQNVPASRPDLGISISDAPDPVRVFHQTTHTVTVWNSGDAPATNVQIASDRLPAGVDYDDAESTSGCDQVGKRVVCTLDTIGIGQEKSIEIAYSVNVPTAITLGATASATEPDVNPGNNTDTESTRVLDALQITLTGTPDPIHAGENLTYELRVTNPWPEPAADVLISSAVPEGASLVSVSSTLCNVAANIFSCSLSQLDPGQSLPFRFVVKPEKAGTLENRGATVTERGSLMGAAGAVTTIVRPANDDFADRQLLEGGHGVVLGSNVHATGEALNFVGPVENDSSQVTKSVWYEWTPTYEAGRYGSVTMSTAGSRFDTVLSVYAVLADGRLRRIVSNDDAASDRSSKVTFNAIGGLKHFISVEGFLGAEGDIVLSWNQGLQFVPGPHNQVVTRIKPGEVNAGTGAEVVVVEGRGFDGGTVGFVDGEQRPTVVIQEGDQIKLAVELSATDKAFPGVAKINIGNDGNPQRDHYFPLPIGNFTKVRVNAGESASASTRRLLSFDKPEPITRVEVSCGFTPDGLSCSVSPLAYRSVDGMYCDPASFCWETLRQYQIAKGFYCDEFSCTRSLDEYRATHNGQNPVDPALPGQLVGTDIFALASEGLLRLGSVKHAPGAKIPQGATLIGNDGAGLIGNDGASLLGGLRAADLISDFGAGVVSNDGAGVVSNDGAGLIGDNGAGLIGDNGAGLIGNDAAGEAPLERSASGWFVVRGSDGKPATITNTTHPDGSVTGEATLHFDDASQTQFTAMSRGMIFALVVPDQLEFSTSAYSVAENDGQAQVTVTRTGTSVGRVTVQYETEDDTATAGSDYTAASGTLIFESGEMSKTFPVRITSDSAAEAVEKIKLKLTATGGIVRLGAQTTAELAITAPVIPWQNPRERFDANDDRSVTPIDALVIINELNEPVISGRGGLLPAPPAAGVRIYYDVSGDGFVAPIDALIVINFLNDRPAAEAQPLALQTPHDQVLRDFAGAVSSPFVSRTRHSCHGCSREQHSSLAGFTESTAATHRTSSSPADDLDQLIDLFVTGETLEHYLADEMCAEGQDSTK